MATEKKGELFTEDNELKPEFFKLDKIGKEVQGVLVEKKIVTNSLKTPSVRQTIYTLMRDDKTLIYIGGRGNQDPQVITGLEQAKLGEYVGLKYTEDIKSTKAGYNDTKILKVYSNQKMCQYVLDEHRGVIPADGPEAEDLGF